MPFFDLPAVPLHHGQPVAYKPERVIKPTAEEARDTVEKTGITVAWCRALTLSGEQCRERLYFIRFLYSGGWGPIHRVRNAQQITEIRKRLKEPIESDWVMSSLTEYPYTQTRAMVR